MGKKGANKFKGKPVVMTQAEFFQQKPNSGIDKEGLVSTQWENASNIFGSSQSAPKPKVPVSATVQKEKQDIKQPEPEKTEQDKEDSKEKTDAAHKDDWQESNKKRPETKQEEAKQKPQQQQQLQKPAVQQKQVPVLASKNHQPEVNGGLKTKPAPPAPTTLRSGKQPPPKPMPMPPSFGSYGTGVLPPMPQPGSSMYGGQFPGGGFHPSMRIAGEFSQPVSTGKQGAKLIPTQKPESYEDAMRLFSIKSESEEKEKQQKLKAVGLLPKSQPQQAQQQQQSKYSVPEGKMQEDHYYDEEADDLYGEEYDQMDMLQDPEQVQLMLSQMAKNPLFQAQLNPNQLSMLMDQNQVGHISSLISGFASQPLSGGMASFPQMHPSMENMPLNVMPIPMPQPYPQMMPPQMMQMPFPSHLQQYPHPTLLDDPEEDPEAYDIANLIEEYGQEAEMQQEVSNRFDQLKPGKKLFNGLTVAELEEIQDDEEIIDLFLKNPDRFTTCQFYMQGNCRYGDACKYNHPPVDKEVKERQGRYTLDEECCICLEKVLAAGRQFGVLDNCDHTFCLRCIRGWRSTYDKRAGKHHFRTCPICRKNSFLVVPSEYLVKSGPEKNELIEEYKEALKAIPCKHFNRGKGQCPFMNSCLYAHLLPNGTPYEYPWKDTKLNEEGEWEDDIEPTLAQRFGNLNI